jgi:hypothetical protein
LGHINLLSDWIRKPPEPRRGLFRFEFWGNRQSDAKRAARPNRFGRSSMFNDKRL